MIEPWFPLRMGVSISLAMSSLREGLGSDELTLQMIEEENMTMNFVV